MSTQVGYRIRGIEPPDLARYPDPVKLMYWGWVVQLGLRAKDRDLAAGLDKDGVPLRPLTEESIKRRKSEVGPTFKNAPPLEPSYGRSRVRSLLTGRAHTTSAEFFWRFDSVSGRSFADILIAQRDAYDRDVFGLSPLSTAWVQAQALAKWEAWQATAGPPIPPLQRGGTGGGQRVTERPVRPVLVGRTDLANMDLMGDEAQIKRAIKAGQFTGFRRLNAVGERWTPSYSAIGSTGQPPATYTTTQRQAVERALAVPFKMQPRAIGRDSVILVDVTRLDDALAADPGFYVASRGRGASAVEGRYEEFQRFLLEARATGKRIEMPRVVIGDDGKPSITDGRHRFSVFRDQGAGVLPVSVPRYQADKFRQEYGATAAQIRAAGGGNGPPRAPGPVAPKPLKPIAPRSVQPAKVPRKPAASLADQPSYQAHNSIAAAASRLSNELSELPGVSLNRNGSAALIADMGEQKAATVPMGYHGPSKTILINERCRHWDDVKGNMKRLKRANVFCTGRTDHLELHEIAHARHHRDSPQRYNEVRSMEWPTGEDQALARQLSTRAAASPSEFVSEFYVAKRAGVKLESELETKLLLLYQYLGGPQW